MEIKYIAMDGKEFDNEDKCYDYEWNLRQDECKKIKMFTENLQQTTDIERCHFVKIENAEQAKIFIRESNYFGTTYPQEIEPMVYNKDDESYNEYGIGEYYYNEYTDNWKPIKEKIKELQAEIKKYKNIFK